MFGIFILLKKNSVEIALHFLTEIYLPIYETCWNMFSIPIYFIKHAVLPVLLIWSLIIYSTFVYLPCHIYLFTYALKHFKVVMNQLNQFNF